MEGIRSPQIGDLADFPESRIWPISEWPTILPEGGRTASVVRARFAAT